MSTPQKLTFSSYEASVLYTIPKPGANLRTILRYYISTNRDACPTYQQISNVLRKAIMVGIISKSTNDYVISDEWFSRIHAHDNSAENEIESMLQFEEEILDMEFDAVVFPEVVLTKQEYDAAASGLVIGEGEPN